MTEINLVDVIKAEATLISVNPITRMMANHSSAYPTTDLTNVYRARSRIYLHSKSDTTNTGAQETALRESKLINR
jgi:hypothetical protein